MRHHLVERGLLSAYTGLLTLELISSANIALSIVAWCCVLFLLFLHSPRRELSPLYASLGLRVLQPLLFPSTPSAGAVASFWSLRSTLGFLTVATAVLAWVSSLLFPWPDFSQLHGPHQTIGCRFVRLSGVECRVFYPSIASYPETTSQDSTKKFVPYLHHGHHLMRGLGVFANLPSWLFSNMSNAHLAALQDAPVASAPASLDGWPIVIFSHGLAGSLELYSSINQELASHGNVVVVLNHCDGSACVCSPEPGRTEYYQQITPEIRDDINGEGFRFRNRQLRQRISEVRAVLDAIVKRDSTADSVFNECNLSNVNVAGHSFGAATALSVAHQDARFKKMVLLDAWMEPLDDDVRDGLGSRVPALHLLSEHFLHWRPNAESTKRHARGCTHVQSRLMWLRDSMHNNFSDLPVFSPTLNRLMKSAGKIEHFRALEAVAAMSAAFLSGDFDTRAPKFPEVVSVAS